MNRLCDKWPTSVSIRKTTLSATKQKTDNVSKMQDRRVRRTIASLSRAFAELLVIRSYDSIRVSDITRRADVGRATFYSHYDCKDDLLRAELGRIFGTLIVSQPDEPWLLDTTAMFAHVKQARRIFRALMRGTSRPLVSQILREVVESRVIEVLELSGNRKLKRDDMPLPLVARFVASSLLALLDWWEEQDMSGTPDEMQAAFRTLVGGGVGASFLHQPSR